MSNHIFLNYRAKADGLSHLFHLCILQGNYENRTVFESLDIGWQLLRSLTSTDGRSPHEIMTSFQNLPQGDVEEDPSFHSG